MAALESLIVGEVNRGKSKSVELCLAAMGVRHARYRDISNAFLKKLLLGGGAMTIRTVLSS